MSDNSSAASGGIGFFGLLTILFIALKLCNVIAWGWAWVFAPLWIPIALGTAFWLFMIFIAGFMTFIKSI